MDYRSDRSLLGGRKINGRKGSMLEGGSRVPLIANWKGTTPAGRVNNDLVDFSDFFATFAEAAGAKMPEGVTFDSRSFAPQLRGGKGQPREWVYVQLGARWYVREQGYKLTESGELFDMRDAPFVEKPVTADAKDAASAAAHKRLQGVPFPDQETGRASPSARALVCGFRRASFPARLRRLEAPARERSGGAVRRELLLDDLRVADSGNKPGNRAYNRFRSG